MSQTILCFNGAKICIAKSIAGVWKLPGSQERIENASSLPWGKCVSVYCIFWREKRDGKYKSRLNKTKVNKGKEGGGKQKAKGKGSATQHRGGLRWTARLGNWDGAGYYSRREATCGEQDGDTGATDGLIERAMRQASNTRGLKKNMPRVEWRRRAAVKGTDGHSAFVF